MNVSLSSLWCLCFLANQPLHGTDCYISGVNLKMEVVYLDYVLVPLGLLVLVLYHIWLMITIVRSPQRTAIGVNSSSRRRWIYRMMSNPERNGIQAVQGLRNNLMLSTVLATIAITAISQVTSSSTQSSSSSTLNYTTHQYKYFALRLCLLTAFLCNMLCSIYYANVSLLVIDPSPERRDAFIKYVATELNRGAFFFSLGSRAFYFALALWLWTFGPIPMFSGSCLLPFVLYITDTSGSYSNFGEGLAPEVQRNHDVESIGSMSPQKTVIGINNVSRRRWIYHIMNDPERNGILAVQSLRNNLMASTVLASIAITLSSLISAVVTSTSTSNQSSSSSTTLNYTLHQSKYFAVLLCFLTAFFCNMQCTRYYAHVSLLVNVPSPEGRDAFINYVAQKLHRGGFFWSLGLRAFYFAFPLLLWTFGPIPMFAGSCLMAFVLYFLDTTSSYSNFDEGFAKEDQRNNDVESIGSIDTVHSGESIVYFSLPGRNGEGSTSNPNFLAYAI